MWCQISISIMFLVGYTVAHPIASSASASSAASSSASSSGGGFSSGNLPFGFDNAGNVFVNFGGYRASAGLGGLLTGDLSKGGLHAEAGTPTGQYAGAGLGGLLGGNGLATGGLYAGARSGAHSASTGLGGAVIGAPSHTICNTCGGQPAAIGGGFANANSNAASLSGSVSNESIDYRNNVELDDELPLPTIFPEGEVYLEPRANSLKSRVYGAKIENEKPRLYLSKLITEEDDIPSPNALPLGLFGSDSIVFPDSSFDNSPRKSSYTYTRKQPVKSSSSSGAFSNGGSSGAFSNALSSGSGGSNSGAFSNANAFGSAADLAFSGAQSAANAHSNFDNAVINTGSGLVSGGHGGSKTTDFLTSGAQSAANAHSNFDNSVINTGSGLVHGSDGLSSHNTHGVSYGGSKTTDILTSSAQSAANAHSNFDNAVIHTGSSYLNGGFDGSHTTDVLTSGAQSAANAHSNFDNSVINSGSNLIHGSGLSSHKTHGVIVDDSFDSSKTTNIITSGAQSASNAHANFDNAVINTGSDLVHGSGISSHNPHTVLVDSGYGGSKTTDIITSGAQSAANAHSNFDNSVINSGSNLIHGSGLSSHETHGVIVDDSFDSSKTTNIITSGAQSAANAHSNFDNAVINSGSSLIQGGGLSSHNTHGIIVDDSFGASKTTDFITSGAQSASNAHANFDNAVINTGSNLAHSTVTGRPTIVQEIHHPRPHNALLGGGSGATDFITSGAQSAANAHSNFDNAVIGAVGSGLSHQAHTPHTVIIEESGNQGHSSTYNSHMYSEGHSNSYQDKTSIHQVVQPTTVIIEDNNSHLGGISSSNIHSDSLNTGEEYIIIEEVQQPHKVVVQEDNSHKNIHSSSSNQGEQVIIVEEVYPHKVTVQDDNSHKSIHNTQQEQLHLVHEEAPTVVIVEESPSTAHTGSGNVAISNSEASGVNSMAISNAEASGHNSVAISNSKAHSTQGLSSDNLAHAVHSNPNNYQTELAVPLHPTGSEAIANSQASGVNAIANSNAVSSGAAQSNAQANGYDLHGSQIHFVPAGEITVHEWNSENSQHPTLLVNDGATSSGLSSASAQGSQAVSSTQAGNGVSLANSMAQSDIGVAAAKSDAVSGEAGGSAIANSKAESNHGLAVSQSNAKSGDALHGGGSAIANSQAISGGEGGHGGSQAISNAQSSGSGSSANSYSRATGGHSQAYSSSIAGSNGQAFATSSSHAGGNRPSVQVFKDSYGHANPLTAFPTSFF